MIAHFDRECSDGVVRRGGMVLLALFLGAFTAAPISAAAQSPPPPTVSIFPSTVNERSDLTSPGLPCAPRFPHIGYTGPCELTFGVFTDPHPPPVAVQVTVSFSLGTASASDVQLPAPVTLVWPAGGTPPSLDVIVPVVDDGLSEADETVIATITSVSGATIAQGTATGTILDDEPPAPAPNAQIVAAGNSSVTVAWSAVTPFRGTLAGYSVVGINPATNAFVAWERVRADTNRVSVAGLSGGTPINIYVVAETTDGYGVVPSPLSAAANPGGPAPASPSPPTVVGSVAGNGFVSAQWSPPANDGGAPIRAFSLVAVRSDNGSLVTWRNLGADVRSGSISGLTNGVGLDVYVIAWNQAGPTATPKLLLTPSAVGPAAQSPGVVPFIWATYGVGEATAFWGPPTERGLPVLGYSVVLSEHVRDRPVHVVEWRNVGPDERYARFSGLDLCLYDVHVVPFGAAGFGDATNTSIVVPPPATDRGPVCQNPPE